MQQNRVLTAGIQSRRPVIGDDGAVESDGRGGRALGADEGGGSFRDRPGAHHHLVRVGGSELCLFCDVGQNRLFVLLKSCVRDMERRGGGGRESGCRWVG